MLRNEGFQVNEKLIRRIARKRGGASPSRAEEDSAGMPRTLHVPERARPKMAAGFHGGYPEHRPHVSVGQSEGRLHAVCVAIDVDHSLAGTRVAEMLE